MPEQPRGPMPHTTATNAKTVDILTRARARIDRPSKWCRYWSVSEDGKRIAADAAVRWSVANDGDKWASVDNPRVVTAMQALADESGHNRLWTSEERVVYANGARDHRNVMVMFDRAIAKLA